MPRKLIDRDETTHEFKRDGTCRHCGVALSRLTYGEECEKLQPVPEFHDPTMRRERTLQLTIDHIPKCDWQAGSCVQCPPGKVIVEMASDPKMYGVLHLPDRHAGNLRPDIGTVIAAGEGVDVSPGDIVIVSGYDGTWREDFEMGDYKPSAQVRCYGTYVQPGADGEPWYSPWYESILATIDENMSIHPTRNNVLARRDPVLTQDRGILLTSASEFRNNVCTVLEVGPGRWMDDGTFKMTRVKTGDRVVYHPEGLHDIDASGFGGDPDLCIFPEESCEGIVPAEAKVEGIRYRKVQAV